MRISTPDIALLEVEAAHKSALQQGASALQALLGVAIPEGWPQFPEAFQPSGDEPSEAGKWPAYFFICPSENALVGNGGFASPPGEAGEVEIGYEIAPAFQNRGFATAAARALLDYAFSQPEVQAVIARALAEENASNAVLRKVGMTFVGEVPDDELGVVWRWRKSRVHPHR